MSARPYSVRFIVTAITGAWIVYTVPAQRRAVVKELTVVNWSVGEGKAFLNIGGVDTWTSRIPGGETTRIIELRHVAYAGEEIRVYTQGDVMTAIVTGYLFVDDGSTTASDGAQHAEPPSPPPPYLPGQRLE